MEDETSTGEESFYERREEELTEKRRFLMRAIVLEHPGPPEVLEIRSVPRPEPRPGWVLIQVKAFGLNRSELFTRQGYSPGVSFPRVLGIECVGVVQAASLLVLRRDTLRIIDGEGPGSEAPSSESPRQEQTSETETEQVSSPHARAEQSPIPPTEQADQAQSRKEAAIPATTSIKCTFSGMKGQIPLKRFQESGVTLVECPDCACTRSLEPHGGVLRFKSHNKRKTTTPNIERRWAARGEMDWDVVGS